MRTLALLLFLCACGPTARGVGIDAPPGSSIDAIPGTVIDANNGNGDGGSGSTYNVYAHADHVLYQINVQTQALTTVGNFNAPQVSGSEDTITDLAVAPDGTIWVISETQIYTASATDGHVTLVGSLAACGNKGVALTFTTSGSLYEGDFSGKICKIDTTTTPPTVAAPVTMSGNMAIAGDIVAVDDGSTDGLVYGTVYNLSDASGHGTQLSNVLATINLDTGAVTQIGATGYPKLFGISYANGNVLGFTHDGTGHVISIDRTTGVGTIFGTFSTPGTSTKISFAGAGVSSLVPIVIN